MNILKLLQLSIISVFVAGPLAWAQEKDIDVAFQPQAVDVTTGNYRKAITDWSKPIEQIRLANEFTDEFLATEAGSSIGLSLAKLLLRRGEAYLRIGFFNAAYKDLSDAMNLADTLGYPALQSMVTGVMGQLQVASRYNSSFSGERIDPFKMFEKSLDYSLDTGVPELMSVAGVRLGEWLLEKGEYQVAFGTLQDAVLQADSTRSLLLQANARIEYARAARLSSYEKDAIEILRNALARVDEMPEGYSRAELALAVGRESAIFGGATANNIGVPALKSVVAMSGSLADKRLVGSALGNLSGWYEQTGDRSKAIEMLERAIGVAPDAHDLAIDWEFKLARIYRELGDSSNSIESYRRAAKHIDRVRQDIPVSYTDGKSSFQKNRAPIYFELADLLMQQSDKADNDTQKQMLLFEAQAVMETLKGSELRDYFRDTCSISQSSAIGESLSDGAATIYPVILQDRLALLVNIEGKFYHFSTKVTADAIQQEVFDFAEMLRDYESDETVLKASGKKIYDWVMGPILPRLQENGVEMLVVIPDGVLRTIPFAALWNGSSYLVESYQIATAPGLTLLNADPLVQSKRRTLVAGVTLPGDAIASLPDDYYVSAFSETLPEGASIPTRGQVSELRSEGNDERVRLWHRLDAVEFEVALPEEYDLPSTVLLNEEFQVNEFKDQVLNNPYQIVHIASHGFFGGEVEDSWIMTHDDIIDLGELSALFKPKEFSENPVELLILSACETAAGNDLAPLGLSGVALASGARSVLGSLWVVSDSATQVLMDGFYQGLQEEDSSKASALQVAQSSALATEELGHPYYWAPFILMGNWR